MTPEQVREIAAQVFDQKLREFANRPEVVELQHTPIVGSLIAKVRAAMLGEVA
jgi:hypothetical protein